MELGDILYLILIIVFIVFGIFKDLKKKKRRIEENNEPTTKSLDEVFKELFGQSESNQTPPPVPEKVQKMKRKTDKISMPVPNKGRYQFQSSMELTTNFEGESSLSGYDFPDYELESPIEKEIVEKKHHLLEDLAGDNSESEFRKAIIYSEILKRKY